MKLVLDPHFAEQACTRGIDVSMLLFMESLKQELKDLLLGQKLVKNHKGTTIVFKKSKSSDTVYLKTAWGKYPPSNNKNFQGASHAN